MKKSICILVLFALITAGAFAADLSMSAGGGLLLDISGNNGIKLDISEFKGYVGIRNLSFGGFVFFDLTYAEFDISIAYGSITGVLRDDAKDFDDFDFSGSIAQLGFSLLGKYPIDLGAVTFFPLLGINYNVVLSAKDKDGYTIEDIEELNFKTSYFNQFGFLLGAGLDVSLTQSLFLRAETMLQIRLPCKAFKKAADLMKDYMDLSPDTTIGLGPRFKIGIGYKF